MDGFLDVVPIAYNGGAPSNADEKAREIQMWQLVLPWVMQVKCKQQHSGLKVNVGS